ncbi:MAG: permease prefix domain 1-containing protein [Planctomycetota bacterium]
MSQQEFEHYLSLLARMLRLTPSQRDAIADELRTHLEERLDELQQEGHDRDEAIRLALDEFGDANALAADFALTARRTTQRKTRRRLMQTTAGTLIAAAAVTFTVMTLTPNNFQGAPTQASATADPSPLPQRDQVSLETRVVLVEPAELENFPQSAHPIQLPGFAQAFVFERLEQLEPWWRLPSSYTLTYPSVTTFFGQRAYFMSATQTNEGQMDTDADEPPLVTTSRGLTVGSLVQPSPNSDTLRFSLDLQTVWSEPNPDEPSPSFGDIYGDLLPARPIGAGWNPGLTGLRFQFEAKPQTLIALKLPIRESQLGLTDGAEGRDVWLIAKATVIRPDEIESSLLFPGLNDPPVQQ